MPVWIKADGSGGAEVEGAGAGEGVGAEDAGAGEAAEDGPSDPRACALRVPGNLIMGSSRFQQFFFMYAKLMAGMRDSKVKEYETTPRATQSEEMRVGKPRLEELD